MLIGINVCVKTSGDDLVSSFNLLSNIFPTQLLLLVLLQGISQK